MSSHASYFQGGLLDHQQQQQHHHQQQQQQQQHPHHQQQQQQPRHYQHQSQSQSQSQSHHSQQAAVAPSYASPVYDMQHSQAYPQHTAASMGYGSQHANGSGSGSASAYGMGIYQPLTAQSNAAPFSNLSADSPVMHQHHQHLHGGYQHGAEAPYGHHMSAHGADNGMSGPSSSPPLSAGGHFHGSPQSDFHHGIRPKRRQVKNACINCQKACKKCDEGRPCTRCVKYGLTDTCIDSMRKERKRGIKRGPYKRRATNGSAPQPKSNGAPGHSFDSQAYPKSEGSFDSPSNHGSYDVSGYSYRSLASNNQPSYPLQGNSGAGSISNNGNTNGGSNPSPSLLPRPHNNSAWATSPVQTHLRAPLAAPGSGSNSGASSTAAANSHVGMSFYNQESRSSSAPLGPQISPVSAAFPSASQAGRSVMASSSPAMYSAHPLPSPSAISSMLGTGSRGNNSSNLFSPPALPSTGGSYLSASSSHSRLHSDGSLAYSSSSGSTANFSSPRTPLSAVHDMTGGMGVGVGADASSASITAGPYMKSPAAYVHHPSSTTAGVGSIFSSGSGSTHHQHLPASLSVPRPFPLQMPQMPRSRGGGSREMMNPPETDAAYSRASGGGGGPTELVRLEA
ncbi:unnamed protein product [Parajaminaea phylloscopi]